MGKINTDDYYLKIPSGYKTEVDGYIVEPIIYQPTPKGEQIIADYYNDKYDLSISVIDHADSVEKGSDLKSRFKKFQETFDSSTLEPDKPQGFILMHGQNHSVPVIMSKETQEDGSTKDFMMVFDSTSGSRIKGYYPIADMFPDKEVLLNNGTRQKDGQSCITDSTSILKDALRIEKLGTKLSQKSFNYDEYSNAQRKKEGRRPNMFKTRPPKNDNFHVFNMPPELCKTAQVSDFLEKNEVDFNAPIIRSKSSDSISLGNKRESDRSLVSLITSSEKEAGTFTNEMLGINRYLHKKSKRHAEIIDKKLLEMQVEQGMHISEPAPKNQDGWVDKVSRPSSGKPNNISPG